MYITSYSDARANLAALMDRASDDREEIWITRRGRPNVVLLDAEEYERLKETVHLLGSQANAASLQRALEQAEHGEGSVVTPEDHAAMRLEIEELARNKVKSGRSETLERLIREAKAAGTYGSDE